VRPGSWSWLFLRQLSAAFLAQPQKVLTWAPQALAAAPRRRDKRLFQQCRRGSCRVHTEMWIQNNQDGMSLQHDCHAHLTALYDEPSFWHTTEHPRTSSYRIAMLHQLPTEYRPRYVPLRGLSRSTSSVVLAPSAMGHAPRGISIRDTCKGS
jgi:hypothetical protein